jgi:hypothetical protein
MTLPDDEFFIHRSNSDGTTDSICKRCFKTVGTSAWEAKLALEEKKHICDPEVVTRWKRNLESSGIKLVK